VRHSWVTKDKGETTFQDKADFEKVKKQGDGAIKNWIDKNIDGTSVTVVCVGEETCNRKWVRYEIQKSIERGNGIIFVKVHNMKDQNGKTCKEGDMDFGDIDVSQYPVHDYANEDGYQNMSDWIEASAQAANRPPLGPPPHRSSGRTGCGRS
jgi:MTH538 TIR-like domain (DUF1863).